MSTAATEEKVVDPQAAREWVQWQGLSMRGPDWNRLPEKERGEIVALGAAVNTLIGQANELVGSGNYTPVGVRDALSKLQPDRARVAKAIERFEASTSADYAEVIAARERIEGGRQVRGADGMFKIVEPPERTALTEIRASEIRRDLRGLPRSEARAVVLAAYESDDREVMYAIETAPRSLPVVDASVTRDIAARRFERSGWKADHDLKLERISLRRRTADRARRALAIDD